jgi:hypothetical protein
LAPARWLTYPPPTSRKPSDGTENFEVASTVSSFQLPPWLTEKIMGTRLADANNILLVAREEILHEIGEQATIDNVSLNAKLAELEEENDIL